HPPLPGRAAGAVGGTDRLCEDRRALSRHPSHRGGAAVQGPRGPARPAFATRGGLLMCRSIVQLRRADAPATDEEVEAAALQFVRKISGYRKPSKANEPAFNAAVDEIAAASRRLLDA